MVLTSLTLLPETVYSQVIIKGSIIYKNSKEAVVDASLIVKNNTDDHVLSYAVTDIDGLFLLELDHKCDSLRLEVRGFNNKTLIKTLPYQSQGLVLHVEKSTFNINESYVSVPPVERATDTLKYNVSSYLDTLVDRTVADVLKKMPGINVGSSGKIQFNGKDISSFHIEGMDLMGGRYGTAVNNIRARDIKRVEVIEHYQAKRVLDAISNSDDVALNLVLSSKAKNSYIFSVLLGGGYKPFMWEEEFSIMNFTSKQQMLISYKSNNTGNSLSSETKSLYDGLDWDSNILTARQASSPGIDASIYLDNSTNVLSMNYLKRIGKSGDVLRTNILYDADARKNKSYAYSKYYLTDDLSVDVEESLSSKSTDKSVEIKNRYMINNSNLYLHEQLSIGGKWDDVSSSVITDSYISERVKFRDFLIQNNLSVDKPINDKQIISFNSVSGYSYLPSQMMVSGGIFDNSQQGSTQEVAKGRFQTKNTLDYNYAWTRKLRLISSISANLCVNAITSSLVADSLPMSFSGRTDNNIQSKYGDVSATIELRYQSDKFNTTVGVSPSYGVYSIKQAEDRKSLERKGLLTNAHLQTEYRLSRNTILLLSSTISDNYGDPSAMYRSFIMTDYRTLNSNWGRISEKVKNTNTLSMRYSNPLKSIFASCSAEYWWQRSDITKGVDYSDYYSSSITYDIPNTSDGVMLNARLEKRFDGISTLVSIPIGYSVSDMEIYRQDRMMRIRSSSAPLGISVSTQLFGKIVPEYSSSYSRNRMMELSSGSPITTSNLRQSLGFSWAGGKHLVCKPLIEHYYLDDVYGRDANTVFADLSLSLKYPKIEYSMDCRNLFGTDKYSQSLSSDYSYLYSESWLRPRSILLKIRFNFGI